MNKTARGVSCVIPFYNERRYIRRVLNAVTGVDCIKEIVCVDDGSTDRTDELIRNEFPGVRVIRRRRNGGKAQAVRLALDCLSTDLVLLLDADLRNLDTGELCRTVYAMQDDPGIDMIIMRRINVPWYIRFYRIDTLLSGERILKTSDLRNVLREEVDGYQLEIAIDLYMYEENKRVFWIPSSARNTFKFQKLASARSILRDMKMYFSVMGHVGFGNLVKLIAHFGKDKLPEAEEKLGYYLKTSPR